MTVGTASRRAVRPGDRAVRRSPTAVAVTIEIVAVLGSRGVITRLQPDISLRVDVQSVVADGGAVADGICVALGTGEIIVAVDMLLVIRGQGRVVPEMAVTSIAA